MYTFLPLSNPLGIRYVFIHAHISCVKSSHPESHQIVNNFVIFYSTILYSLLSIRNPFSFIFFLQSHSFALRIFAHISKQFINANTRSGIITSKSMHIFKATDPFVRLACWEWYHIALPRAVLCQHLGRSHVHTGCPNFLCGRWSPTFNCISPSENEHSSSHILWPCIALIFWMPTRILQDYYPFFIWRWFLF